MAQTGFTPGQPTNVDTPSTDGIMSAMQNAAHLLRRAAAVSPSRDQQIKLHHAASDRETQLQHLKDLKKSGGNVFGFEPDSAAERKITILAIENEAERARLLIPSDFRPEPKEQRKKVHAMRCTGA